jgi:hypothetical protein
VRSSMASPRLAVARPLAPHLAPEQKTKTLAEALAAAKAIGDDGARARALGSLAPHLASEQIAEALAAAKAIGPEGARAEALGSSRRIAPEQIAEALTAAKAIGPEGARAVALGSLAPYISPSRYAAFITSLLDVAARLPRPEALSAISASVHISAALGGVETLEIIRRAINDTARWYP